MRFSSVVFLLIAGGLQLKAATLLVTTTADSGAGSLRQAILDANTNSGSDTITFQISGTGVHTIAPLSTLPAITTPVVIDGTTQPGYATQPLIELNGASAGANSGLRLNGGNSTVRGLAINRFLLNGIDVSGPGTNVVAGNFIGTDPNGAVARGNAFEGILVLSSTGNIIGGTNASDRNVISGNADAGVYIQNSAGNTIIGNFIGTTAAGTVRLPNTNNGVAIYNSTGTFVGDTNAASRNIISGNLGSGVYLVAGSSGNVVQGNYIGLDVGGSLSISNGADGISCQGVANNTLGGAVAGAGNVISGNGMAGVSLSGGATGNSLLGNFIGPDAAGAGAIGNTLAGVTISGAASNQIGGVVSGARNVISGNRQDGVYISTNSSGNVVLGNFIGLNPTGTGAMPNFISGVKIAGAVGNVIGGALAGSANVISGNSNNGVFFLNGASGNSIKGNFIGTDVAGAVAMGNRGSGVRIESPTNTVGGGETGARNIISGNFTNGIWLVGSAAAGNVVQSNFIGVAASGVAGLGNGLAGVGISGAVGNSIGTPGAGNMISANKSDAGIFLLGTGTARNAIQGNVIGADVTGNSALGNFYEGIYLERAATNTIGGVLAGAGNLISGNNTRGIWLTNASWNVIQGNYIGTRSDGVSALGNTFHNVECETSATNNTIGGSASGAGNRIAFAQSIYAGVRIRPGSSNNAILGNSIFSNAALGIDLGAAGVTPNDVNDVDAGANMQQNFPVITQAVNSGAGVGVRGAFNSLLNKTFLLQFFASPVCDGSGNGEGQIYLGDKTVGTDASGNASFVAAFPAAIPPGYVVTGTATDPANNTSEFSPCFTIGSVPSLFLASSNQQATLSWTNTTTGFVLKQTGNLLPPVVWTTVTNVPANVGGNFVVTIAQGGTNRFFVLSFE